LNLTTSKTKLIAALEREIAREREEERWRERFLDMNVYKFPISIY
jgi:7,8-dihydro-6-hydroxymethylpterin-pyrophosphokinase